MCEPTTLMMISAGMSVVGQIQQGIAQQEMYDAQARATATEAGQRMDAAKVEAEKIRKAGRAARGEAKTALAASGVKLGEGSALEVDKQIMQDSEQDALSALLTGKRIGSAANEEIGYLRQAGNNAMTSSILGAAGSVAKSGWQYSKMAKG